MKTPDFTYKKHIDGIRAVAVVSVILFHLNPSVFPGGYLGVDIFFVISGFVITQSLYKNYYTCGRINVIEFYIKRFKRLYPALVAMVMATTTAYIFFGFLWDTNLFLKSAVTSIFATSNLYFLYHGENYFQQDLVNPLIHTWSLGIEEQFYVVYPLLLALALWGISRARLSSVILSLVFLGSSIFLYVLFSSSESVVFNSFYSPFARFWELGAGCALFFFSQHFPKLKFAGIITILSFGGIVGIQFFQSNINSLQIETLSIVLATSGLLYAGINSGGATVSFLSHKITTYIGRLSYSLYLWHFPVIYFVFLYFSQPWAYIWAIIISIGCAMFSYHYIEKPLRYSVSFESFLKKTIRISPYIIMGMILVVLSTGTGAMRTAINQGFNVVSEYIKPINYIESNFNLGARIQPNYTLSGVEASVCADTNSSVNLTKNEQWLFEACLKYSGGKTLFFLTGDSHAFHFLSTLDNSSVVENLYFIEIPRQSIVSENPNLYDREMATQVLQTQKQQLLSLEKEFTDIYYITSFFLSPWQNQVNDIRPRLEKYIETLQDNATLIFIAPTPVFPTGPESCVLLNKHCTIDKNKDLERRKVVFDMLIEFEEKFEKVFVYDAHNDICPEEKCVIYDPESDFLRYMDQDHLSVEQSIILSPHFDQWMIETFNFK